MRQAPSARCGWTSRGRTTRTLTEPITCDLLVVGGGYTGLWTALHAAERNPDRRIVLIEANRIGWAASGRNGGFVDASLTHGAENGKARWPNEIDTLEAMGIQNLDGMQSDIERLGLDAEWQRTGMLSVATEPHQVDWLRRRRGRGRGTASRHRAGARGGELADLPGGPVQPGHVRRSSIRPSWRSNWPARARTRACTSTSAPTPPRWTPAALALRVDTGAATVTARQAVLATNVYPSLLRRNRLHTVPVYDYVLATEPLTDAQLDRIGWRGRQGIGDCANQFHYYRLTMDNRIVWGGYDAVYHFGRKVDAAYEDRPATYRRLAAHFFITFPQLDDVRFSHRWAGAIDTNTRFCAHWGLARDDRVAYVNGFTGLGVGAARFAADVCLDLLEGSPTPRTELRDGPRAAVAVPAGAVRQRRHPGDAVVAGPRRPLGGTAQHLLTHAGRAGSGIRFLTRASAPLSKPAVVTQRRNSLVPRSFGHLSFGRRFNLR